MELSIAINAMGSLSMRGTITGFNRNLSYRLEKLIAKLRYCMEY